MKLFADQSRVYAIWINFIAKTEPELDIILKFDSNNKEMYMNMNTIIKITIKCPIPWKYMFD